MSEIELLRYLMDDAFEGKGIEQSNEAQSLMSNLATVDSEAWTARLPGSARTIESIAIHVGACKVMYADYAFGSGTLRFGTRGVEPWMGTTAPMSEALEWLRGTHRRLMEHVASLTDADLMVVRRANWGELRETRWLLSMLLQHDVYHAGEINHSRSLRSGDDRWRFQQLGFG